MLSHRPSVGAPFDKVYRYLSSESHGVPSPCMMSHITLAFAHDRKLSATDRTDESLS